MRRAKARQQPDQAEVDALTALQVEERQHLGPEELRAELRRVGPRGARGRRRIPGFLRRRRLPGTEVVNGVPETWSLGCQPMSSSLATRGCIAWTSPGQRVEPPVLTADHDGVIVADVVAEWARRHGEPFRLELTGSAGGSWSSGTTDEEIVMDAADFCRVVSGRPTPDGGQPQAAHHPGPVLRAMRAPCIPPDRRFTVNGPAQPRQGETVVSQRKPLVPSVPGRCGLENADP